MAIQNKTSGYGYLDCYNGLGTGSSGYGIAIVGNNGDVAANDNGAHMNGGTGQLWCTNSGVGANKEIEISSDYRLKNNIHYFSNEEKDLYKNLLKNLKFSSFELKSCPGEKRLGLIA